MCWLELFGYLNKAKFGSCSLAYALYIDIFLQVGDRTVVGRCDDKHIQHRGHATSRTGLVHAALPWRCFGGPPFGWHAQNFD